jgi:hypothetical protein
MGALGLLGTLFRGLFEKLFASVAALLGATYASRLAAVALLASTYVGSVTLFTTTVAPWWEAITSTSYGAVLGLLFPPISGTVVAALMLYRGAVIAMRYTAQLLKMAVG